MALRMSSAERIWPIAAAELRRDFEIATTGEHRRCRVRKKCQPLTPPGYDRGWRRPPRTAAEDRALAISSSHPDQEVIAGQRRRRGLIGSVVGSLGRPTGQDVTQCLMAIALFCKLGHVRRA